MLTGFISFVWLEGKSQQVVVQAKIPAAVFSVNVQQGFQFGSFTQGNAGGIISISPEGIRTGSGAVVPLNFGTAATPLVLELQGQRGSMVSMLTETSTLTGSNGGSMTLKITGTNPPMPFIIPEDAPEKSIIKIGAELMVGNAQQSPPGNYSGSLNISFVLE